MSEGSTITLKIRVDRVDPARRVTVTLFAGRTGQALANIGTLHMTVEEYQLHGAALFVGAASMSDHLVVEYDNRVFTEWSQKEAERDA